MPARIRHAAVVATLLLQVLSGPVAAGSEPSLDQATALISAGQPAEALVLLHDIERRLPEPRTIWELLGTAYLQLGWQLMNHGDEAAAHEAFDQARNYLPDDPRPLRAMALAWLHAGQPAAALGPLQEALSLAEGDGELLRLLGRAFYAQGDLVQAEEAWADAALAGNVAATPLLERVRRERQVERDMERALAGRFTLAYAAEVSRELADAILAELQQAYNDLGSELGFYPEVDIPVLLYARDDFAAVTRSPAWAGAVYDGKIRVPLGGLERMTPALKDLLRHEYAHVLARFLGKGRVPVWLNEGFAGLVEVRQVEHVGSPSAGRALPPEALERPFTELSNELVPLAYAQSRMRVGRMVDLCGWSALGELMRQLGNGQAWEAAVAEAYAPCGYDWPRLQAELNAGG